MNTNLRVALDTNVVFEGLTIQKGACGLIIDAWFASIIDVFVFDALAYEYLDVLSRKLSEQRWQREKTTLVTLLEKAQFVQISYTWRPTSPDPGDDLVIDCAMNANALLITANLKDFQTAVNNLGLHVLSPIEFVNLLAG